MVSLVSTPISIQSPSLSSNIDLGTAFKTYVIPVAAAIVISHVVNTTVDNMFKKGEDEKKINELYDGMIKRVEGSQLPRTEDSPEMKDTRDMTHLIEESIVSLKRAQQSIEAASVKTKCGVCQNTLSKIGSTLENDVSQVVDSTKGIMSASKKYSAMKTLKKNGRLPPDKKWSDLTDDEKALVKSIVED